MEPALLVDSLAGELRLFIIAQHHIGSAAHNLVGTFQHLHLHARKRKTHSAQLAAMGCCRTHRNHGGRLSKSVPLIDVHTYAGEETGQTGLYGTAARDKHFKAASEGFANLTIDKHIRPLTAHLVPPCHTAQVVFQGQTERPEKDTVTYPLQRFSLTIDTVIHLLNEAGDGGHHVRTGVLHVFHHLGNAFGIPSLVTHILVQVIHHPLIHMAQREEAHRTGEMGFGGVLHAIEAGKNILMAKHYTFWEAGGAAGVNHRGDIARLDGIFQFFQLSGIGMRPALGHQFLKGAGGIVWVMLVYQAHALQGRQIGQYSLDLAQHILILKHQILHFAIAQDVAVVVLTDGRIDGHQHGSHLLDT